MATRKAISNSEMSAEKRPEILSVETIDQFQDWYWLKVDLVKFCKANGLSSSGRKLELRERIVCFLNGEKGCRTKRARPSSTFDWANEKLTLDTPITDSVTFGKNFRGFMQSIIGAKFVCHSDFMDWVKSNTGATLKEAAAAWRLLEQRKSDPTFKRKIAPQNLLNQYMRDFFKDNPSGTRAQMMR